MHIGDVSIGETPESKKYMMKKEIYSPLSVILLVLACVLIVWVVFSRQILWLLALYPMFLASLMPMNSDEWLTVSNERMVFWQKNLGKRTRLSWELAYDQIENVTIDRDTMIIKTYRSGQFCIKPERIQELVGELEKLNLTT